MAEYIRSDTPAASQVDEEFEAQRAGFRQQAQEWAGLNIDPNADLFIFIGRWSKQKGVDVIADVFPSILARFPSTQLICIGPVIDLYGKFAALKLGKMMEMYQGRVYSKPEFTSIPSYIHKGAEFALMPSRDEPFGLVAVEFGRKGALCIGARVGGFGNMPGWWFPVESMTTKHMINQFRHGILAALGSSQQERKSMRACCSTQRFPVQKWLQDLKSLHLTALEKTARCAERRRFATLRSVTSLQSLRSSRAPSPLTSSRDSRSRDGTPVPLRSIGSTESMRSASSHTPTNLSADTRSCATTPPNLSQSTPVSFVRTSRLLRSAATTPGASTPDSPRALSRSPSVLSTHTRMMADHCPPLMEVINSALNRSGTISEGSSRQSSDGPTRQSSIRRAHSEKAAPIFDDAKMRYYQAYSLLLNDIAQKSHLGDSLGPHIEEYIVKSEQDWHAGYHHASLGLSPNSAISSTTSLIRLLRSQKVAKVETYTSCIREEDVEKDFYSLLGEDYIAPKGLRRLMLYRLGDWHYYTISLAAGQILCANPYQLTLLTGQVGAPASKLYTLCSIYLIMSGVWWMLHRYVRSVYLLAAPFFFFGFAFLVLAASSGVHDSELVGHLWTAGSCLYTVGSASYAFYFALNFGTEAGIGAEVWAWRACVMTGLQQLLVAFMWYWGSFLTADGKYSPSAQPMGSSKVLIGVGVPMTVLMWALGAIVFFGLPDCYRQPPGIVPSFYRSVLSRPIVSWFLVAVTLQCFWLSTNYTRNWMFLWSSNSAPRHGVALLVVLFFGVVWFGLMASLIGFSKRHAWIVPIFAVSLGAPRWCQMLWSLSGIGNNIPWASTPALGALLSRAVWLWIGVLDGVQGVGMGAMLLMSLTRVHTAFTLVMAQVFGAFFTILARMVAPHKTGPLPVFPNLAAAERQLGVWFWCGLLCQLLVCTGFLKVCSSSHSS